MTDDTKAVVESWKPAPGWETRLEVSNLGNIRTIERIAEGVRLGKPISQKRPAKLLSPWIGRSGYRQLAIKVGTRRQKVYLHRLVAMAFVSGYADGLTVNHINGNRLDNRSDNLEWVTLARNTAHQWEIGLVNLRGENHPSHKLSSAERSEERRVGKECRSRWSPYH